MEPQSPQEIYILDEMLICKHCGFEQFYSAQYNPSTASQNFPGLDWMNKSAEVFICSRCGFLHWFATTLPEEVQVSPLPQDVSKEPVVPEKDSYNLMDTTECLSCGKEIPKGRDQCLFCGWSYKKSMTEE